MQINIIDPVQCVLTKALKAFKSVDIYISVSESFDKTDFQMAVLTKYQRPMAFQIVNTHDIASAEFLKSETQQCLCAYFWYYLRANLSSPLYYAKDRSFALGFAYLFASSFFTEARLIYIYLPPEELSIFTVSKDRRSIASEPGSIAHAYIPRFFPRRNSQLKESLQLQPALLAYSQPIDKSATELMERIPAYLTSILTSVEMVDCTALTFY